MRDLSLDVVLCSPDESSQQVAQVLASAAGAKVRVVASLSDVDMGLWKGLRTSELAERYPTVYKQWLGDPTGVQVPGGESLAFAEQRILEGLIRALEKTKSGHPRVGVVLRPMAWAIVRCWLRALPLRQVGQVAGEEPCWAWHEVERERLDLALSRAEP
jgi:broad specificity phosphatase PhoE